MKNFRGYILFIFCVFLQLNIYATAQFQDILFYKNDTVGLSSNPLEQYPDIQNIKNNLLNSNELRFSNTALRRGYIAYWEIDDNKLYLTAIKNTINEFLTKKKLRYLFGRKFRKGRINADWVNMELVIPKGKLLKYLHGGYESLYSEELSLQIKKGRLISETNYVNSNPIKSEYTRNPEVLDSFIYSNIDWDKFSDLTNEVEIFVEIMTNEKGKIDSAWVYEPVSENEKYNSEALRVTKIIPLWDVYFRRNKLTLNDNAIRVVFSLENKRNYKDRKPVPNKIDK